MTENTVLAEARQGQGDDAVAPFPREKFLKFCEKLKIQSRDYGLVQFRLLGSQLYILDEICKGLAEGVCDFTILKSRQLGASTFFLALDLFWAFLHKGILGVFATHEEASRDQFRAQIDLYLATLPKAYRVGENTNNRTMLVLKNTSLFRYLVAGSRTTTNKLGRSGGTNFLHATECAFWGSPDDIASLNQTLSHLYPHRLYIKESTANGFNHYEEMCRIAQGEPSQKFIFVGWWRDERNEFSETHPNYKFYMPQGVSTPLSKHEKDGIKAVKAEYDFNITAGQIAWYRWHLATQCAGDQSQMDQEQPWTPEDAFVSTGSAFFSNDALTAQFRVARNARCMPFIVPKAERWQDIKIQPTRDIEKATLKIWEEPTSWGKYTIGVDVAFGSSSENDRTVISVRRCWADRCEQVAEYATPEHSTYQCACMVAYLGGLYRDCMVNLEVSGPGVVVLQELDRLRNETPDMAGPDGADLRNALARMKDFLYRRTDSLTGNLVRQWKTSAGPTGTKTVLMNRYKNCVELGIAQIRSLACIEECRLLRVDGGSIEAASGHDDRAIADALAVYAWAEWRMRELKSKNWTHDRSRQIERDGGEEPMGRLMRNFMDKKKITMRETSH